MRVAGNAAYLLDTVIVAALFNGEVAIIQKVSAVPVYVSSITIGELYFGAYKSARLAGNMAKIHTLATQRAILNCNRLTAERYGEIKEGLRIKGKPIPENDIWIAATALQHNLILVSRDAHFNHVDGLGFEQW